MKPNHLSTLMKFGLCTVLWTPCQTPAAPARPAIAGSFFGVWRPTGPEGLERVEIRRAGDAANIQVWYLATYGNEVPWPKTRLVFFWEDHEETEDTKVKDATRAMASWAFDTGYVTWTLKVEGSTLLVETFTKILDGRTNVHKTARYKRVSK